MGIKERLYEFIERKGLSVAEFERSANLSNGYIRGIRDGIGTEKMDSILRAYPDLNMTWLLQGEGEMLEETTKTPDMTEESRGSLFVSVDTDIRERMKRFIAYKRLSRRRFELSIGVSNSYVQNMGKGMSVEILNRISETYPELNTDWLMTGEGEMLRNTIKQAASDEQGTRTLPLIPIEALAGRTTEDNFGIKLQDCEQYAVPEFMQRGAQCLIRVSGDSMIPRYYNGDIIAIKRVEEITFFQWGKIYVLDTNQGALIKRVYEDTENKDNIICHSENSEVFADFSMPKEAIRGMFVIAGLIRTE